jgi:hypothetical protein
MNAELTRRPDESLQVWHDRIAAIPPEGRTPDEMRDRDRLQAMANYYLKAEVAKQGKLRAVESDRIGPRGTPNGDGIRVK